LKIASMSQFERDKVFTVFVARCWRQRATTAFTGCGN
jgi:hypothetical protein